MHIVHKERGDDGNGVFAVIDVRDLQRRARVHVVREGCVADARHAVADHAHALDRGQVQRQVHRFEQRKRSAERVSRYGDGGCVMLREHLAHFLEDGFCRPELRQLVILSTSSLLGSLLCVLFRKSTVHLDRGGEAGEKRRVQGGKKQLDVRQIRET